ncbi:hypothetical protein CMI47_05815 [Candidatus Pacearchaeota archaeon]|nr:hypothetical protein [Candidatus Pacearchaeota archaeon]|tara:strand:+ start:2597 stop:2968 length:372 start_codon:yes stop_codon:yes gene_type:complete
MSEIIYTKINPKNYVEDINLTISNIDKRLVEHIKKDGIKFPVLGFCNNKIIKFIVGTQRIVIAFKLGLTEVPAILYSYDKTGFDGEVISELNDVVKLCGKDIINEPVYNEVRGICNRIRMLNG